MAIVFIVLIVLSYVVKLQWIAIKSLRGNKESKPSPVKAPEATVSSRAAAEEDDEEILAVIAAAVAAALGRPISRIKVRSIRRIEPAQASWTAAGRQAQMNDRF